MTSQKIYQIHPMPATKCLQSLERHLHVPSEFFFVISTGIMSHAFRSHKELGFIGFYTHASGQ